jgi:hypothetical protein
MIRRLAVVFWWVGAIALVLAVSIAVYHQFRLHGCKPILAEAAELEKQEQVAFDKAVAMAKAEAKAAGKDPNGPLAGALAALEGAGSVTALPRRTGLDQDLAACNGANKSEQILAAIVLAVLSLLALIVAYVLGGSFFTPPKAR